MMDDAAAHKEHLIELLKMCQSTIEKTIFNTRVASKAKIEPETAKIFSESIQSQEETFSQLTEIIKGLIANPYPDLDMLQENIEKMVETVKFQENETIQFCRKLFNQE